MNIPLEKNSKELGDGMFDERWVSLSRVYSGIFILDGKSLSPERYRSDCERLLQILLSARMSRFPRFLTRFIIVPVYCAESFSGAVLDHLYGGQRGSSKKASLHPILFNSVDKVLIAKHSVQNETLLIYPYLEKLFEQGEATAQSILVGKTN